MLIEDFAKQHYLCDEGIEMIRPYFGRTVEDCWRNAEGPEVGTYTFWVVSRAQVDPRTIVRCAAQCAQECMDAVGAQLAESVTAMQAVMAWCDARGTQEEARRAGEKLLDAANKQQGLASNPKYLVASAIYDLTRCTEKTIHAPAVTGTLAEAYVRSGKLTRDAAHARFAQLIRAAISWNELDQALQSGRPSPQPRPKDVAEVAENTEKTCAAWNELLRNSEQALERLDGLCRVEKISLDGVHQFLEQDGFGSTGRQLIAETVGGLDKSDRSEPGETRKPRVPRSRRTMI